MDEYRASRVSIRKAIDELVKQGLLVITSYSIHYTKLYELTQEVIRLFGQGEECVRMGQAARTFVEQNQGALQSTVEAVETLMSPYQSGAKEGLVERRIPLMAER